MYYPCSENKDADQLRGYREADLRLCFRPCKLLVFSRTGSNVVVIYDSLSFNTGCLRNVMVPLVQKVCLVNCSRGINLHQVHRMKYIPKLMINL